MKKEKGNVYIYGSSSIAETCRDWARHNTPQDFQLVENEEESDIIISVLGEEYFSKEVLENKRAYNIHPGVLPEYKGSGICTWVILNNEIRTGVTLHELVPRVDEGDIIEIREFMITEEDTAASLYERKKKLMFKMFKDWYEDLLRQDYVALPQNVRMGKMYYKKELQKARNLTKFAKAFHFPNKKRAFYYNSKNEKIYIDY